VPCKKRRGVSDADRGHGIQQAEKLDADWQTNQALFGALGAFWGVE